MKTLPVIPSACLYVEIGQSSLRALLGEQGLELPLERQENGRLTTPCQVRVTQALQTFVHHENGPPRLPALCALGAKGVSLRRLALPPSTKDQLARLLRLQIESEFPLPPDELAWGYHVLDGAKPSPQAAPASQEVIVAAVRKETVAEYAELLAACGISPVFTLAAWARSRVFPQLAGPYALLDIGRNQSELIAFDNGVPASVRLLPWGGESLTQSIAERLGINRDEAEKLKLQSGRESSSAGPLAPQVRAAIETSLDSLATAVTGSWSGQRLFLTGPSAAHHDLALELGRRLGITVTCERMELAPSAGRSAAILGLQKCVEHDGGSLPLTLQIKPADASPAAARSAPWTWAALAAFLAVGSLGLPYAEALLLKPFLARKIAAIKADKARLAAIDNEFSFLQFLKKNQPPYLETLVRLSKAAPAGTRFDSVTMNRRGELALRGSLRDGQQVVDFLSKLVDYGFFSSVVVEEQTPSPDRQKVIVRISAQLKPADTRPPLVDEPPGKEPEKPAAARSDAPPGPPPSGPVQLGPPTEPAPTLPAPPRVPPRRDVTE